MKITHIAAQVEHIKPQSAAQAYAGLGLPCYDAAMRKLMLLLTFFVFSAPALAQRMLPADAQRAVTGAPQILPMVQLHGELLRLAPGGVIIDAHNRSVTHGQLPPGSPILYRLDSNGEITRIIVLTPQEQAQIDRAR